MIKIIAAACSALFPLKIHFLESWRSLHVETQAKSISYKISDGIILAPRGVDTNKFNLLQSQLLRHNKCLANQSPEFRQFVLESIESIEGVRGAMCWVDGESSRINIETSSRPLISPLQMGNMPFVFRWNDLHQQKQKMTAAIEAMLFQNSHTINKTHFIQAHFDQLVLEYPRVGTLIEDFIQLSQHLEAHSYNHLQLRVLLEQTDLSWGQILLDPHANKLELMRALLSSLNQISMRLSALGALTN